MLIWLDLETTGLYPEFCKILSIAIAITDNNLNIIDTKEIMLYQNNEVLESMNEWCKQQHHKSGLISKVKQSKIIEIEAEQLVIDFLSKYIDSNISPMCGNTISQDRRFLKIYMSNLESYFTYQHIDVTTIKLLREAWYPDISPFNKDISHLALDDIINSINELKYYRKTILQDIIS